MKRMMPEWLIIKRKDLVKNMASGVVFCAAYALVMHVRTGSGLNSDPLFLYALLMMVVGLWYIVRRLGLFDYTAYGFKRLVHGLTARPDEGTQDPMKGMDYYEYLKIKRIPSSGAAFATGAAYILLYCLMVYGFGR